MTEMKKINTVLAITQNECGNQDLIKSQTNELYIELLSFGFSSSDLKVNYHPPGLSSRGNPVLPTILVTLATTGFFTALIEAVKSWTLRKESRKIKIKIQKGEQSIEFEYSPSSVDKKELFEFINDVNNILDEKN